MPSLMRSSTSALGATTSAASAFSSVAAQASAVSAFRSRLMSPASSVADTEEDLDLSTASLPPLAPPAATATHERHSHACNSCSELETEFAAAVLFVETYNGKSAAMAPVCERLARELTSSSGAWSSQVRTASSRKRTRRRRRTSTRSTSRRQWVRASRLRRRLG